MNMQKLRNKNLAPSQISTFSLNQALNGHYVGKTVLAKLGELLDAKEFIHWLHALDRLYVLGNNNGVFIDPRTSCFPKMLPVDIRENLIKHHPIFQKQV